MKEKKIKPNQGRLRLPLHNGASRASWTAGNRRAPMLPNGENTSHSTKKELGHYLFEFLMLFLAVTAGFFVDNLREHYVEVQRENQFINSMAGDLKDDIHQLDSVLKRRVEKKIMIDSMLWILASSDPDVYGNNLYYYARWLPRINRIFNNDGTMTQLKNAGNLRLIRSLAAREAMMKYDQQIRFWSALEDREESLIQQYYPLLKTMFDSRVFEEMVNGMEINRPGGQPHLLTKDKAHINELFSAVHFLKNVNTYQIEFGEKRMEMAKSVLAILKKEYHLK